MRSGIKTFPNHPHLSMLAAASRAVGKGSLLRAGAGLVDVMPRLAAGGVLLPGAGLPFGRLGLCASLADLPPVGTR